MVRSANHGVRNDGIVSDNSSNKLNVLPGEDPEPANPDSFSSAPEFVSALEHYVRSYQLPVVENSKVISIEKPGEVFVVSVSSNNEINRYFCKQVLIASGVANEIKIPSLTKNISKDIKQLHTSEYKNADQLPDGNCACGWWCTIWLPDRGRSATCGNLSLNQHGGKNPAMVQEKIFFIG